MSDTRGFKSPSQPFSKVHRHTFASVWEAKRTCPAQTTEGCVGPSWPTQTGVCFRAGVISVGRLLHVLVPRSDTQTNDNTRFQNVQNTNTLVFKMFKTRVFKTPTHPFSKCSKHAFSNNQHTRFQNDVIASYYLHPGGDSNLKFLSCGSPVVVMAGWLDCGGPGCLLLLFLCGYLLFFVCVC